MKTVVDILRQAKWPEYTEVRVTCADLELLTDEELAKVFPAPLYKWGVEDVLAIDASCYQVTPHTDREGWEYVVARLGLTNNGRYWGIKENLAS